MINDTFHRIPLGPKWRSFLEKSRERVRPKNQLTPEVIELGIRTRIENAARRRETAGTPA